MKGGTFIKVFYTIQFRKYYCFINKLLIFTGVVCALMDTTESNLDFYIKHYLWNASRAI